MSISSSPLLNCSPSSKGKLTKRRSIIRRELRVEWPDIYTEIEGNGPSFTSVTCSRNFDQVSSLINRRADNLWEGKRERERELSSTLVLFTPHVCYIFRDQLPPSPCFFRCSSVNYTRAPLSYSNLFLASNVSPPKHGGIFIPSNLIRF